jgi:hypothetical protein
MKEAQNQQQNQLQADESNDDDDDSYYNLYSDNYSEINVKCNRKFGVKQWPLSLLGYLILCLLIIMVCLQCLSLAIAYRLGEYNVSDVGISVPNSQLLQYNFGHKIVGSVKSMYLQSASTSYESKTFYANTDLTTEYGCVDHYKTSIMNLLNGTSYEYTNPAIVNQIVDALALSNHQVLTKPVMDYLSTSQPIEPFIDSIIFCAKKNIFLRKLACGIQNDSSLYLQYSNAEGLNYFLTAAIVMNNITTNAINKITYLHTLYRHLLQQQERILSNYAVNYEDDILRDKINDFKYYTINMAFSFAEYILSSSASDKSLSYQHITEYTALAGGFDIDRYLNMTENSEASMSLSANLNILAEIRNEKFNWPVSIEWADSYNSWILALTSSTGDPLTYTSRLTPCTLCTGNEDAETFMLARNTMSLLVTLLQSSINTNNSDVPWSELEYTYGLFNMKTTTMWGHINYAYSYYPNPTTEQMEDILEDICQDCDDYWDMTLSSPLSRLTPDQLKLYQLALLSFTCITTGLLLEIFVGII